MEKILIGMLGLSGYFLIAWTVLDAQILESLICGLLGGLFLLKIGE